MTQQHPITPPFELRNQWRNQWLHADQPSTSIENWLINHASQWGYDQAKADIERERQEAADEELEACVRRQALLYGNRAADDLRAARRPKPQSLKEQALNELDRIPTHDSACRPLSVDVSILRRALEQLPD